MRFTMLTLARIARAAAFAGIIYGAVSGQAAPPAGEWPAYGGDQGNLHYAALDQINASNVNDLKVAWKWSSPDDTATPKVRAYRFEATPIMIKGVLYVALSSSRIAAIKADTGEQLWVYDPESYKVVSRPTNLGWVQRGVSYWTDGSEERIFLGTGCAHLVALDAKTGQPVPGFGENGKVDLTKGMRREVDRKHYAVTSPPIVCRDVVAVGSSIFDGPTQKEMPPGDVRGFDARTGKEVWNFHTIPQPGEFGHETWEEGSWEYTGNANVWSIMAADDDLGYIYLPIGTPTNDWYGGHRPGNGLFGECLVCLDAKTGKRVWHYQMVHHGVWDYDPPAGPILCDLTVGGKAIKAVLQITKQSFVFAFDRVTGEPIWPIEEKAVPQSTMPGEKSSPTQPHPTRPAPYDRQGVREEDLIDFTPALREEAKEILKKYDYGPLFTPPTEKGSIELPGWQGGANWGGAAFDPETNRLFVPSTTNPIRVTLSAPDQRRSNFAYSRSGSMDVDGPKGGTSEELPLFKPPYGRITAINMNEGEHSWMVPHGKGPKNHPALAGMNLPDLGSIQRGACIATKTLLFAAEAAGGMGSNPPGNDPMLRAFDKNDGKIVSEFRLPAYPGGTPMTYTAGGKQFIAVAVGGGKEASEIVALALP